MSLQGYILVHALHFDRHLRRFYTAILKEREYTEESFLVVNGSRPIPQMPVVGKYLILKVRWEGAAGHVIDERLMLELEGIGTGRISLG